MLVACKTQPHKNVIDWNEVKSLDVIYKAKKVYDICWNVKVKVGQTSNDL